MPSSKGRRLRYSHVDSAVGGRSGVALKLEIRPTAARSALRVGSEISLSGRGATDNTALVGGKIDLQRSSGNRVVEVFEKPIRRPLRSSAARSRVAPVPDRVGPVSLLAEALKDLGDLGLGDSGPDEHSMSNARRLVGLLDGLDARLAQGFHAEMPEIAVSEDGLICIEWELLDRLIVVCALDQEDSFVILDSKGPSVPLKMLERHRTLAVAEFLEGLVPPSES